MRFFIERHFGLVLLLACAAGLIFPPLALLPNDSVAVALALLMFVSCYRLREGGFSGIRWRVLGMFYALRFLLLPAALWEIARIFIPSYATGVFLLSVAPVGISSPAFASLYGGAAAPGFALVILSQLLAPFLIPLQFASLGRQVTLPLGHIFLTMVWCILLPMLIYTVARRHRASAEYFHRNDKMFSVLLVAFVIAFAVAGQRGVILGYGAAILAPFAVSMVCFLCYIAFGWWAAGKFPRPERITCAACSAFNNAALGLSLALLYFPPKVVLFMAVSDVSWALLPLLFRGWMLLVRRDWGLRIGHW